MMVVGGSSMGIRTRGLITSNDYYDRFKNVKTSRLYIAID